MDYLIKAAVALIPRAIALYPFLFLAEAALAFLAAFKCRKWLVRAAVSLLIAAGGVVVIAGLPPLELSGGASNEYQVGEFFLSLALFGGGLFVTAVGVITGHFARRR